jgi:hypothetical protein
MSQLTRPHGYVEPEVFINAVSLVAFGMLASIALLLWFGRVLFAAHEPNNTPRNENHPSVKAVRLQGRALETFSSPVPIESP